MSVAGNRPVYLNLVQIRLPIAGFMSILHRISGLFLFLLTPILLYILDLSLAGPTGFEEARQMLTEGLGRLVLFVLLWALAHHLLAGIRYLLLDVDIGVERPGYRYTAWFVVILAPVLALLLLRVLS